MPHQEMYLDGQRVPGVSDLLGVMDRTWLQPWFAKEELARCINELAKPRPDIDAERFEKTLLASWRKRIKEKDYAAPAVGQLARDIGTEFHNWVEAYLKGNAHIIRPDLSLKVLPLTGEFVRYHAEWNLNPTIGQELNVVSKRYVYQGTFDFLGTNNKHPGLCLADWKTSSKIDDTYGLQVALYAYAYGEQMGWAEAETWEKITHGLTVRLDKYTHRLEWQVYKDLPYLFRVAIGLREAYDYRNKVGAWELESINELN